MSELLEVRLDKHGVKLVIYLCYVCVVHLGLDNYQAKELAVTSQEAFTGDQSDVKIRW